MNRNGYSSGEEERGPEKDNQCCLIDDGIRCRLPAGYASYNARIQKTVAQRRLKLTSDNLARHTYICDSHKNRIQSVRKRRRRKDSEDDETDGEEGAPEVDLVQLQMNTLRRYKRHYKVSARQGLNKMQLAETIMEHFKQIPIKEKEVLTYFIFMVKSNAGGGVGKNNGMEAI